MWCCTRALQAYNQLLDCNLAVLPAITTKEKAGLSQFHIAQAMLLSVQTVDLKPLSQDQA
jgi:hypothetical protein